VLRQGVQGISELITEHGLINLDFADVKAIMSNAGSALMGIGRASGDDRASQAAQQAIESPLIEVSIDGAKGVLFNVTGGYDMSMSEIQEAAEIITSAVSPDANIIFGATLKPELEDELIITVIATGFDSAYFEEQAANMSMPNPSSAKPGTADSVVDEKMVESVNLELDKEDPAASFADDTPSTDIWNQPEEDEDDTPAFLRRRKKKNDKE
jgi:cell division protein FtsZ